MSLRLLSYNIRYGGVGREEAIAAAIRAADPDLVVLQEASRPDAVRRIAERAGYPHWGSTPGHSVGFLSRTELESHEWRRPRGCSRSLLELKPAGAPYSVIGVHLRAMHSNWSERRRVRELHAILRDIERHRERFHLVTGDFNTLAPGEKLDRRLLPMRIRLVTAVLGGAVRWRTVQIMLDAGYVDAFRCLHPKEPGFTFPTWNPHLRLDFVFVPQDSVGRVETCEVRNGDATRTASDHFPLLAVVNG